MTNRILVIGGTGMLGRPVVRQLLNNGYQVRLLTHNPDKVALFFGDEVEKVPGDVTDIDSLPQAIKGCDAIYINLNAKMDIVKYRTIEQQGTENIIKAAREVGVNRIAMISGLNVNEFDKKYPFIAAKLAAEKAVMGSGLPFTIFRCCWFYESLPLFIQGNKAILLGKQEHPRYWLAASDFAVMVARSFGLRNAADRIFFIKGSERMNLPVALMRFCDMVIPDTALSPIPLWLASIGSLMSRKPQTKGLIQFMKYFDTHPEPEINDEAEKILGPARTSFEEWTEEYKKKLQLVS